jgi:SAM-dependent methyltransferase
MFRRFGGLTAVEAYRDDLAYIHDTGYGGLARSAAQVLLEDLRRRDIAAGLVVDLGCGSGILSAELAGAGHEILGIDISPAMLARAQQRVPGGQFRTESLLSAPLPLCVAVTAVGQCCNYLFDAEHTPERVWGLFGRIFAALLPGGPFLFDVAEPGRVPGQGPSRSYAEGEDWAALVTAEEDIQTAMLTRHITSFRKVGELYRRDHEVHRLRLLPRAEVALQLEQAGFAVQLLAGYGSLAFAPGHAGFLARKPAGD